jgi:cation diffusion facilitator family transporter
MLDEREVDNAIPRNELSRVNVLKYSTIAVLSVFLVEFFLGLVTNSLAILGDSLHALFDTFSTLMLLISTRASLKPPDEEHMYGHEKFELLGGLIGGIALIAFAIFLAIEAILKINVGEFYINLDFSFAGLIALTYTLSIDVLRMVIFRFGKIKERSPTLRAGFYHALSDFGSTLIALFGFLLSIGRISFFGDSLSSLVLSALLIFLSVRLVWNNILELSDVAPKETVLKIKEQIASASSEILAYENLKVRKVGGKFFVRATLKFPDYMSFEEAHSLATRIEDNVKKILGAADISFHIEPVGIKGMKTENFIEKIASESEGVVGVHDVNVTYYNGKVYVRLHVQVDSEIPLSEAHNIADNIERAISKNIRKTGNVLVHIEPSNIEAEGDHVICDEEINEIVQLIAKKHQREVRVKRVVTYVAGEKRNINIECALSEEVPIEEAHEIASEIEENIKERSSDSVINVHMEPS